MKARFHANINPCSIECFHPLESNQNRYFLCGCYELDEATNMRNGELRLCRWNLESSELLTITSMGLQSGLLDCKVDSYNRNIWCAMSNECLLQVSISPNDEDQSCYSLIPNQSISRNGEGLYLSVACLPSSSSEEKIAVSTQQGSVIVYTTTSTGIREFCFLPQAHSFQDNPIPAWIVITHAHDNNILISGGDDNLAKLWDIRCCASSSGTDEDYSGSTPIAHLKGFDAGVTSGSWHPYHTHLFALGSYDETCTIWDDRSLRTPLLRINTGGGVWRTKWLSSNILSSSLKGEYDYLYTANMQGGCRVYQLSGQDIDHYQHSSIDVNQTVTYFDGTDKHLSYGVDVIDIAKGGRGTDHSNDLAKTQIQSESGHSHVHSSSDQKYEIGLTFTMASCSFYERHIDVWEAHF
jgi:hypothetical protein